MAKVEIQWGRDPKNGDLIGSLLVVDKSGKPATLIARANQELIHSRIARKYVPQLAAITQRLPADVVSGYLATAGSPYLAVAGCIARGQIQSDLQKAATSGEYAISGVHHGAPHSASTLLSQLRDNAVMKKAETIVRNSIHGNVAARQFMRSMLDQEHRDLTASAMSWFLSQAGKAHRHGAQYVVPTHAELQAASPMKHAMALRHAMQQGNANAKHFYESLKKRTDLPAAATLWFFHQAMLAQKAHTSAAGAEFTDDWAISGVHHGGGHHHHHGGGRRGGGGWGWGWGGPAVVEVPVWDDPLIIPVVVDTEEAKAAVEAAMPTAAAGYEYAISGAQAPQYLATAGAGDAVPVDALGEPMGTMVIPTIDFQRLINVVHAKTREDGIWGPATAAAFINVGVKNGWDEPRDMQLAVKMIAPLSGGRSIRIPIKFLANIASEIQRRWSQGKTFAGYEYAISGAQAPQYLATAGYLAEGTVNVVPDGIAISGAPSMFDPAEGFAVSGLSQFVPLAERDLRKSKTMQRALAIMTDALAGKQPAMLLVAQLRTRHQKGDTSASAMLWFLHQAYLMLGAGASNSASSGYEYAISGRDAGTLKGALQAGRRAMAQRRMSL